MIATNTPESRNNSLTPLPPKKTRTKKDTPCKTRQRTKNLTQKLSINKQMANQKFHNAPTKLVPDN